MTIGVLSQGSARVEEVEATMACGASAIPAFDLHDQSVEAIPGRIPDGGRFYLTIDAGGLDPGVLPAVGGPAPGGLTFDQMRKTIRGLVRKGRLWGMDIVEITPSADADDITCVAAGRLIANLRGGSVCPNTVRGLDRTDA